MPEPHVPIEARTTAPHTQPSTQRTPVSAAGAGGPGLHRWPPHPQHKYRCSSGCTSAHSAHNSTVAKTSIAPRSGAIAHHDLAYIAGHTTYSSVCSWGRWTRAAPTAVTPAALTSQHSSLHDGKSYKQQYQLKSMQLPRVPAQTFCTTSLTAVRAHASKSEQRLSNLFLLSDTPSHSNKPETGWGGVGKGFTQSHDKFTAPLSLPYMRVRRRCGVQARRRRIANRRASASSSSVRCSSSASWQSTSATDTHTVARGAQVPSCTWATRVSSTPGKAHPSRWRERRGGKPVRRCDPWPEHQHCPKLGRSRASSHKNDIDAWVGGGGELWWRSGGCPGAPAGGVATAAG
jgi:hypothetical protein